MNRRLFPCLFAIFIDVLGYGLVYPLAASILSGSQSHILPVGASAAEHYFYLSLMYLLYPAAMFFGASFMGDLSDLFGRKKVLLICMLGIGLSFGLMGLGVMAPSLALLLLGRTLSGIFAGSPPIAQAVMADESYDTHSKAKNLSLTVLAQCIGTVLGPFIAGFFSDARLVSWFSYATPFYVAGLFGLIACVWVAFGLESKAQKTRSGRVSIIRPILVFLEAFQDKKVRLLALVATLGQIAFGTIFQMISVALKSQYGYSASLIGYFYVFMGVGFVTSIKILPYVHRALKTPENLALFGYAANGLCVLFFFFVPSQLWTWILILIICLTNPFYYTGVMIGLSEAVDKTRQGWVMGIYGSTIAVGFILSGLTPNLLSLISSWDVLGLSCIPFFLTCLFLGIYIKTHNTKKSTRFKG